MVTIVYSEEIRNPNDENDPASYGIRTRICEVDLTPDELEKVLALANTFNTVNTLS